MQDHSKMAGKIKAQITRFALINRIAKFIYTDYN